MKKILLLIAFACPLVANAHLCPYDWNIKFSTQRIFNVTNITDFAEQFNAAVREETKGAVTNAISLNLKPATFRKIPDDSPFAVQMDELIRRHDEIIAPLIAKGAKGYDLGPVQLTFPSNFSIACHLIMQINGLGGMGYKETKDGAIVTRLDNEFECRAYRVSDVLLAHVAKEQEAGRINTDLSPVSYLFAQESGMNWTLMVRDGPRSARGEFILEAVTYYLPKEKVILVIETSDGHEKIIKTLKEKKFW